MAWSKALNKKYFKKRNINQIKIKDPRAGKTGMATGVSNRGVQTSNTPAPPPPPKKKLHKKRMKNNV